MEEENLRRLVMKKAAAGGKTGSPLISPNQQIVDSGSERYSEPLIQQIGPDFSKLSRELNRVVLKIQHQADSSDCVMHSEHSDVRRGSRAADPVRRRSKDGDRSEHYQVPYQEHRRSLSGGLGSSSSSRPSSRLGSRETLIHRGSLHENNYQSLPRKLNKELNSSKVDRRQSFQDYKARDKYVGKVQFKDTLRRAEEAKRPERTERSSRRGRVFSESQHHHAMAGGGGGADRGTGGYLIESDFDFRSPPSTRDNSRDRKPRYELDANGTPHIRTDDNSSLRRGREQIYATPRRGQEDVVYAPSRSRSDDHYATSRGRSEDIYASSSSRGRVEEQVYASPRRKELRIVVGDQAKRTLSDQRGHSSPSVRSPSYEPDHKDPLSPRRVEFADEVFGFKSSRPGSRCESPVPKSILRHTISDPASARTPTQPAVRSSTAELSFERSRPTTLIIPTDGSSSFSSRHFSSQISINHSNPERGEETTTSSTDKKSQEFTFTSKVFTTSENPRSESGENRGKEEKQLDGRDKAEVKDGDDDLQEGDNDLQDRDSDGTMTEELVKEKESDPRNTEVKAPRIVPPPLADWNRSQSFPQGSGQPSKQERKTSDPAGLTGYGLEAGGGSMYDLAADMDLIRSQNNSLRTRVGDLEQQVVDNNDEIKCLKATLAECLRRIDEVETHTRYCQQAQEDDLKSKRRPLSSTGLYPTIDHRSNERRGSYGTRS